MATTFNAAPLQPAISLSDIIHPTSPDTTRDETPSSPEPLQESEITRMRARALQMGLDGANTTDATPRERELYEMVLRLTNPDITVPDASQLLRQAETISALVNQRDYLSDRLLEERSRWEGEKISWERVSDALFMQHIRRANEPAHSELEKKCENLEFDNKALKDMLDRTQGRITAIERELEKLKPNLLMHYFVPKYTSATTSAEKEAGKTQEGTVQLHSPTAEASTPNLSNDIMPQDEEPPPQQQPSPPEEFLAPTAVLIPPTLHALAQASTYLSALAYPAPQTVAITVSRRKKMTMAAQLKNAIHTAASSSSNPVPAPTPTFPTSPSSARTVQRPRAHRSNAGKPRLAPPPLVASDARAEHLLIAARRIGRERAGIVAGVMSAMEREKAEAEREREQERMERVKYSESGGAGGRSYYRERPAPVAKERKSGKAKADAKNEAKAKGKEKEKDVSTPPTSLDSLVTAAMREDGLEEDGSGGADARASISTRMMTRRRTASASASASVNEEPASKRRRLSGSASSHSRATTTRGRSALDVLADQASAVSSTPNPSKKTKAKIASRADELAELVPKRKRGRPPKNKVVQTITTTPAPSIDAPLVAESSRLPHGIAADTNMAQTPSPMDTGELAPPTTRREQRGQLQAAAAVSREKDDVECEDDRHAAPTPQTRQMEATAHENTVLQPTALAVSPAVDPPPSTNETAQVRNLDVGSQLAVSPTHDTHVASMEDAVLDADADGESDPDIEMETAPTVF